MPTLNWIGKEAVIRHHQQVPYRLLEPVPALSHGDSASGNLIVQGDNLHALKALLPRYAGQVKCIYIDPPYNTGNEGWVYNDNVNSPEIRQWLGETVGKEAEDLSRHDKWLCMMYPRLVLLRHFLREDGAIFISIDDNEFHYLREIMNEVFGSKQWICTLIWKRRQSPDSRNLNGVSADHEYILCYAKSDLFRFKGQTKDFTKYQNPDNDPNGSWMSDNLTGLAGPQERPNLHYELIDPANERCYPPHTTRGWIYGREKMNELIQHGRILWPKSVLGRPRLKRYLSDMKSDTTGFSTLLDAPANIEGTKILNEILSEKAFSFPKPYNFIQILINQSTDKDSLILDSFAGSGTTGHAVLKQNAEDNGHRQFILVEMDETIARTVTAERMRRVCTGYTSAKGKTVEALGSGFQFHTLSAEPLFAPDGQIREDVTFAQLAEFVWFAETGAGRLSSLSQPLSPLLGVYQGRAIYLLYNGILKDQAPDGGNVLTAAVYDSLPPHDGPKTIYAAACRLGATRLAREQIDFKQTPYALEGGGQ